MLSSCWGTLYNDEKAMKLAFRRKSGSMSKFSRPEKKP